MKMILISLIAVLFCMGFIGGYHYLMQQHISSIIPTAATHFSLENAPIKSLKGDIATMSGTVIWLSRVAEKPEQLIAPRMVQQGESLSTGKKGKATVVIRDLVISLSSNSDISFIQLLPTNFVIGQDAGSVTFQNNSQTPVSVRSLDLVTVMNNATAQIIIDNTTVTVMVEKGLLKEGYEDTQNISTVVTLHAGEQFVFDNENKTGTIE